MDQVSLEQNELSELTGFFHENTFGGERDGDSGRLEKLTPQLNCSRDDACDPLDDENRKPLESRFNYRPHEMTEKPTGDFSYKRPEVTEKPTGDFLFKHPEPYERPKGDFSYDPAKRFEAEDDGNDNGDSSDDVAVRRRALSRRR